MKFDVDDKSRCRHLNRCRFAVAVGKCLGGSLFLGHSVVLNAHGIYGMDVLLYTDTINLLHCKFESSFVWYCISLPYLAD